MSKKNLYNKKSYVKEDFTTSYGIILIEFNEYIRDTYQKEIIDRINLNTDFDITSSINYSEDILKLWKVMDSFKFLLIQRKHSLGFVEFMRGKYKIDNVDHIASLFQQMTSKEINSLVENDFDYLWMNFWNLTKIIITDEYKDSKWKFNVLKKEKYDLGLDFFVTNIKPLWDEPEWGFPKGRKNKKESDLDCAMREFQEETDYKSSDYTILYNLEPIIEDFVGTNNLKYRHVYYVALSNDINPDIKININNKHQINEIGNIKLYSYADACNIIRDYHIPKKEALKKIYLFMVNFIIKYII
jgi:hypothetical protein